MNDMASLTGAARTITVDGVEYPLPQMQFAQIGELQKYLDSRRPDPFEIVANEIAKRDYSVAQQKHLYEIALKEARQPGPALGSDEADAILNTPDGLTELLFILLRDVVPGFSRDKAAALFEKIGRDRFEAEVKLKSGAYLVIGDGAPKAAATNGAASPATMQTTAPSPPSGGSSITA